MSESNITDASFLTQLNARSWTYAMMIGIISIVLGILVMAWPGITLLVIGILVGIQLALSGAFRVISSFSAGQRSPVLVALVGGILLLAGIILLRDPSVAIEVFAIIIGVLWIATGVIELIAAFRGGLRNPVWSIILGLLSIIAGVIVLANPAMGMGALTWVTGLYFVVSGIVLVVQALSLRVAASS